MTLQFKRIVCKCSGWGGTRHEPVAEFTTDWATIIGEDWGVQRFNKKSLQERIRNLRRRGVCIKEEERGLGALIEWEGQY